MAGDKTLKTGECANIHTVPGIIVK